MMRVTWTMNLGEVHADVEDHEVRTFVENIITLGFNPEVRIAE